MRLARRALLALPVATATQAWAIPPRLRDVARRAGIWLGAASEIDLSTEPDAAALFASNCDLLAPSLSWQRLAPRPASVLENVDGSVRVAIASGLKLTGYHLLWHHRLPAWFEPLDPRQAERAIVAHIRTMATGFAANSFAWNVINEAIVPTGLRPSPLSDKFGEAFFDVAFHAAEDSAPHVLRVYNDYDLELATPEHESRRTAVLRLLDGLQARGVPVQAVGLQSHLRAGTFDRFDSRVYRRFLAELARRGLIVLITELDVLDPPLGDVAARDHAITDVYARFLDAALSEPQVRSLVFWGLTDRHTWLNDPERRSVQRTDGTANRPLPFDRDLRPKPALDAILAALGTTRRPLLVQIR